MLPVRRELRIKAPAADAEYPRGALLVAFRHFERLDDEQAFGFGQRGTDRDSQNQRVFVLGRGPLAQGRGGRGLRRGRPGGRASIAGKRGRIRHVHRRFIRLCYENGRRHAASGRLGLVLLVGFFNERGGRRHLGAERNVRAMRHGGRGGSVRRRRGQRRRMRCIRRLARGAGSFGASATRGEPRRNELHFVGTDDFALREDCRLCLDHVAQLANVARPAVTEKALERSVGETAGQGAVALGVKGEKTLGDGDNVFDLLRAAGGSGIVKTLSR